MPKLSQTEDWVEAIRVFIRDTLGNKNWQIVKNKEKTMLGIRFEDGTRSYKYIPYKWQRSSANEILIKKLKVLRIKKKETIHTII